MALLDDLDLWHAGLAEGKLPRAAASAMRGRLETGEPPADPKLAEIVEAIELRVAVELAKCGS
jgi:hypothetical protein